MLPFVPLILFNVEIVQETDIECTQVLAQGLRCD